MYVCMYVCIVVHRLSILVKSTAAIETNHFACFVCNDIF